MGSFSPGLSLPEKLTSDRQEINDLRPPPQTPNVSLAVKVYLQDFHFKPTVRRGAIWYLEGLNKGLCELLHHGEDQDFGRPLGTEIGVKAGQASHPGLRRTYQTLKPEAPTALSRLRSQSEGHSYKITFGAPQDVLLP